MILLKSLILKPASMLMFECFFDCISWAIYWPCIKKFYLWVGLSVFVSPLILSRFKNTTCHRQLRRQSKRWHRRCRPRRRPSSRRWCRRQQPRRPWRPRPRWPFTSLRPSASRHPWWCRCRLRHHGYLWPPFRLYFLLVTNKGDITIRRLGGICLIKWDTFRRPLEITEALCADCPD